MSTFNILLIIFCFLNALDLYSTWLGLYKLPDNLKGEESNPFMKDIEKTFFTGVIKKVTFIVIGIWAFFWLFNREGGNFVPLVALNIILALVCTSNLITYFSRRVPGRKVPTLIGLVDRLLRKVIKKDKVVRLASYYLTVSVAAFISYFIAMGICIALPGI